MGTFLGIVPRFGVWIHRGLQGLGYFQAGQVVDSIGNLIDDKPIQGPPKKLDQFKDATLWGLLGFTTIYFGYKYFTKK